MKSLSPFKVMAFLWFVFFGFAVKAQDCSSPQLLCSQSAQEQLTTADGAPVSVPAGFCFPDAPNAVFFEFNTLDLSQFPGLAYEDSSATLSIADITCNSDTLLGQGVNMAVFSAGDPCDPTSYDPALYCETGLSGADDIPLESLQPSTTYYVLVTGLYDPPPAVDPSECTVSLSISGPAVTYDLEGDWHPENDEGRTKLFEGETAVLLANPNLDGLSWTGENLNSTSGNSVTANPEGVDVVVDYTVEATINECIYSDVVSVPIVRAIKPDNVFTPNGDGYNDQWYIKEITEWPNAQINVYSRWGSRVFQATNYQNDWGGDDLPAATYYYVIELNPLEGNANPYTGSVTIVR